MSSLPIVLAQRSSLECLDLHPSLLTNHDSWHPTGSREVLPAFGFERTTTSERLERLGLPHPIEVLVPKSAGMRACEGIVPRGHQQVVLMEDLVPVGENIYACMPELALTESIAGMSAPRAATVVDQLVSSYRIVRPEAIEVYRHTHPTRRIHLSHDPDDGEPLGMTMYGMAPLVTLAQLREYAEVRSYVRGIVSLRRGLPLCTERLRSPLEAEDYLLLFSPRFLGGINLPRPLVNEPLELSRRARVNIDRDALTPDFRWPDQRVIVEVLGAADHEGSDVRIADTSIRERLWRTMEHDVITHTRREIETPSLFAPLAKELAGRLGVRYRTDISAFAVRQMWLRHEAAPPIGGRWTRSVRSWRDMLATNDPAGTLEGDAGWLASLEP